MPYGTASGLSGEVRFFYFVRTARVVASAIIMMPAPTMHDCKTAANMDAHVASSFTFPHSAANIATLKTHCLHRIALALTLCVGTSSPGDIAYN